MMLKKKSINRLLKQLIMQSLLFPSVSLYHHKPILPIHAKIPTFDTLSMISFFKYKKKIQKLFLTI